MVVERMKPLGFPLLEAIELALVVGACWTFGGAAGLVLWNFITSPFRKGK
jgi:hypothetical protein